MLSEPLRDLARRQLEDDESWDVDTFERDGYACFVTSCRQRPTIRFEIEGRNFILCREHTDDLLVARDQMQGA